MYDPATAKLIRSTPDLEGLDRDALPERLSEAFAQIAAARLRLRTGDVDDGTLAEIVREMRRLAFTNEALVSVFPERKDRAAAAYVSAAAHQLCFNAKRIVSKDEAASFLAPQSISADISAMLLFLVAEATADAAEIARHVRWQTNNPIERRLIAALRALAQGRLTAIIEKALPDRKQVAQESAAETAASALYLAILEGVRAFASRMLSSESKSANPVPNFRHVQSLSAEYLTEGDGLWSGQEISTFAGPYHLASLMISVSTDLAGSAVVAVPPPGGTDAGKWCSSLERFAKTRPFLWRNHREAIEKNYLEPGYSAAIGFPTGAGKSTLAELKINATLLRGSKVIFLAPTHALVDQTTKSLRQSFPTSTVQKERFDELGFLTFEEDLPEILVMTPEACLTQMSVEASVFEAVGLLVFDECHLLHPSDGLHDRRAIDAMLCVLNFSFMSPQADFLLLSAMMKNTDEIAGWIELMTGRPCLSLSLAWKPTRQLRGSVVYQRKEIDILNRKLTDAKKVRRTKAPSTRNKESLAAQPLGLFSLKQTWETRTRDGYSLLELLNRKILLSANASWSLTPNSGEVSSEIGAAATEIGIKTLIFFQSIKNATSAIDKVVKLLGAVNIPLKEEETMWLDLATLEMGGPEYLYIDVKEGALRSPAVVHHGLLLPEERYLCESVYKRSDGVGMMTATSTLAQGMNLPSELVIIAEDSRFDERKNKREILKAQELLNAAGRAGRAGQNANGVVLVIPGNVIAIDRENRKIGSHWTMLQTIFSQSDQCLDIDDPLTALLDRVFMDIENAGEIERYTVVRLATGGGNDQREQVARAISRSFAAYRAHQRDDQNWIDSRIDAATRFYNRQAPESENELAERQVAATLGIPFDVVTRFYGALEKSPPAQNASISEWRCWIFKWLEANPDILDKVFRKRTLDELFGDKLKRLLEVKERSEYALPFLCQLTKLWMAGRPLRDLEAALGTDPEKLKTCNGARKFVLRVVPEMAYFFGLPVLLRQRKEVVVGEGPAVFPPAILQLGRCIRLGFNMHEKAALIPTCAD